MLTMRIGNLKIGHGPAEIPEWQAEGEIARVYHEIRQSLRVSGVSQVFRSWATLGKFLPRAWDQLRPNVETTAFDRAGDEVRGHALRLAGALHQPVAPDGATLGESRSRQIRAAVELSHYINPKLLVLVCAVRQALQGTCLASAASDRPEPSPRGEPAKMFPMEMESGTAGDSRVRRVFKDIQKVMSLSSINSDYRTLALWPDYLTVAWEKLRPVCETPGFTEAADALRLEAQKLASQLPCPMALSLGKVKELGQDPDEVLAMTSKFEALLPGLILNIAMLHQDWQQHREPSTEGSSSGSASSVTEEEPWRSFQMRQHHLEFGDHFVSFIDQGGGEPVVLLHGIPTWGFLWEGTLAALRPGFRVLVPDLLGYGYSAKRDNLDRSITRQAEMLDAFLERLGVGSAHIVGHDIGGGIALRLATLFSQRVRSLTVMNSVCYDSWPVEVMLQMGHPQAARRMDPTNTLKMLKKALGAGFHQAPDSSWLDGLLAPWRTETGRLSLVRNASGLNTSQTTEITRLLPGIRIPTLVLWGEDDPFQPVRYGERLARDIPGATLVRVARARHFVMIDQEERVSTALQEFLRRSATTSLRAAA